MMEAKNFEVVEHLATVVLFILQGLAYISFQLICLFIGSLQRYDVNGVVEVQGVTSIEDAQSKPKQKTMNTKTSLHMISTKESPTLDTYNTTTR